MRHIPDLSRAEAQYCPFSDTGIFGTFFQGSCDQAQMMSYVGALLPEVLSEYLTDEEVTRAKNLAYNELLNVDSVSDAIQQYGP